MKDSPKWFWFAVILVSFLMVVSVLRPFELNVTPTGAAKLVPGKYCPDGTEINTCSKTQPKFCTGNLRLVDDCSTCGCIPGKSCSTFGACLSQ
ncbi:MAG: hypothetical protein ABIG96_02770 [Candidatus Micrarchaeota archaeon]